MTGPSEMAGESLNVLWADAQLLGLVASYDQLELEVRESTGRTLRVVADGHIGLELVGFWDEMVIESADIVPKHPFADRCIRSIAERLGQPPPATGSPTRNAGNFSTLVVVLSDGARLLCAAAAFRTVESIET